MRGAGQELQKNKKILILEKILDNTGQGFLFFGADLCVNREYSPECTRLLNSNIANEKFYELLFPQDKEEQEFLKTVLKKFFNEKNKIKRDKVYFSLLPKQVKINNKYIRVEYKRIRVQQKIGDNRALMVILTDITEEKFLERKMKKEESTLKMVVKVIGDYNDFIEMINDFQEFCQNEINKILNENLSLEEIVSILFMNFHNYKGSFSLFEMNDFVAKIHDLETALFDFREDLKEHKVDDLKDLLAKFKPLQCLEEEIERLKEILGDDFFVQENLTIVKTAKLIKLENRVKKELSANKSDAILEEIRRIRYEPFRRLIKSYPEYVEKLAKRFGKKVNPLVIEGGEFLVDHNRYYDFSKSLVHIFRNIIDHGLEFVENRLKRNKEENGNISCKIELDGNQIILTISDDGQGIDFDQLKAMAIKKGMYSKSKLEKLSRDEIMKVIFKEGFSTKSDITQISGRGVGLAAVKKEVDKLEGSIEIKSTSQKGTEFKFYFRDDKIIKEE